MIRFTLLGIAALAPLLIWFLKPSVPLISDRRCYTESVYIFHEKDQDVVRVSRYWTLTSKGEGTGSYYATLLFYRNGEIVDRKELARALNFTVKPLRHALSVKVDSVSWLSGIKNEEAKYRPYLDPLLYPGFSIGVSLFTPGNEVLLTGLAGRPRTFCNPHEKMIFPAI